MKLAPPKNDRDRRRQELLLAQHHEALTGIPCRVQIYRSRYGWAARAILIRPHTRYRPHSAIRNPQSALQ